MFTKLEKEILNATDSEYKYIYRDYSGKLYLKDRKNGDFIYFDVYNHMFKSVKNGAEPICFRKPVLDAVERKYLKAVFEPFKNRVNYVKKVRLSENGKEYYIWADIGNDQNMVFPTFKDKKKYQGMTTGKRYTLEELGITYDD